MSDETQPNSSVVTERMERIAREFWEELSRLRGREKFGFQEERAVLWLEPGLTDAELKRLEEKTAHAFRLLRDKLRRQVLRGEIEDILRESQGAAAAARIVDLITWGIP